MDLKRTQLLNPSARPIFWAFSTLLSVL